jgi:hypothetical protein
VGGNNPSGRRDATGRGGHYPHETAAGRLLPAVRRILATTAPFRYTESRWRELLAPDATAAI